jgi:uncharacterized protein
MPSSHRQTVNHLKTLVKKQLRNEFTGHGYWHSYRVARLALKIGRQEGADLRILELAAWLHDLGVTQSRKNHHLIGAQMAKQILKKLDYPSSTVKAVVDCILKHRYSRKYRLNTIEEKVLQDADNLDALGATIIPRIFAYCGVHRIPIYDPNTKPDEKVLLKTGKSTTGFNHIYEKLLKIPKILNTPTAKKLAQPRIKFLKLFARQYLAEFQGKI